MPTNSDLWLDDLTVGQEFFSGEHVMDAQHITGFAAQFDPQPLHLDPEAAPHSLFQGVAASGWHMMAITMKLLVDNMPLAQGILGAGAEISWPQPTRPGDALRVKSQIAQITPSRLRPDRAMVLIECAALNQNDAVLQVLKARLLVFRKDV